MRYLQFIDQLINGKRTYLCIGLIVMTALAQAFGFVDPATAKFLYVIFSSGAGASLRAALQKTQDAIATVQTALPVAAETVQAAQ